MTVIRVAHRKRFTVVAREAVNDERLSFRARGVLLWLLDKPDDWMVNAEQMAKESPEGRDAIRAALRELEKTGYLRRESVQGDTGRWRTVTTIYESPAPENPSPVAGKPTPGNPTVGIPGANPLSTVTEDCLPKARSRSLPRGDDFLAWYSAYPKHVARGDAEKAWKTHASELPSLSDLLLATKNYANSREVERGFVKLPATWLRAKCWLDEYDAPQAVSEW